MQAYKKSETKKMGEARTKLSGFKGKPQPARCLLRFRRRIAHRT
jgi:hypothetical protein